MRTSTAATGIDSFSCGGAANSDQPERGARSTEGEGDKPKLRPVRDRVVEYDLRFMRPVCNWAETVRVNGPPLLERSQFRGFPVPVETNPDRPITTRRSSKSCARRPSR